MAKTSFIDTFELCVNAVLLESKDFNSVLFTQKHCALYECREINFDKVENRLAYVYKFGSFNIQFVKKCTESFLENCPIAENIFARENLTICSLSNGPGLDIIGLLGAIYESSKRLKCFPNLNMINLRISWGSICRRMLTSVYKAISSSCDTLDMCNKTVHIIQSDIYSTIPPEAKDCIRTSDILLMVKVFASSKATNNVVTKSMEEICSFLKSGSLVFFVGSKKNTKELTEANSLSKFVNCILGPIKISIEDLSFNGDITKLMGIQPKQSGNAYFLVWQKKDTVSLEVIPSKKKRNTRKKNKAKVKDEQKELTDSTPISSELMDDIDACSEVSFSSCSKQSETSDESKTTTCEDVCKPASPVELNREILNLVLEDQNLLQNDILHSINSITSLLDKFHMQPITVVEETVKVVGENIHELKKESICDIESDIQDKQFKNCMVKEEILTRAKKQGDSINEISVKQTVDIEKVLNEIPEDSGSQVKYIRPTKGNDTHVSNKSNMEHSYNEERHILATQPNKDSAILKANICNEVNVNDTCNVENSVNKIYLANMDQPVIQSMNNEKVSNNEIMKVPKKNKNKKKSLMNQKTASLLELNIESKKNGSKIILGSQLQEKFIDFQRNTIVKEENVSELCEKNKPKLNSLLKRCENLVTSLETLTANFKKDLTLNNDQDFRCCIRESCAKFRNPHASISSCCIINTMQSNCCKKVYNCQRCKNSTYATISRTLPCRSVNEIHKCSFEREIY